MDIVYPKLKKCTSCLVEYTLDFFTSNKRTKDKLKYNCKKCISEKSKPYNFKNKESRLIRSLTWAKNNKDRVKEISKKYLKNNPKVYSEQTEDFKKKCRARAAKYREKNKEKILERNRKWRIDNPGKSNYARKITPGKSAESWSKRRSFKINATPLWLTKDHLSDIKFIYSFASLLAKETNKKYHVDHIIPLNNKSVCGLHVPWNLQILKEKENCIKNNSNDGTYENKSWKQIKENYGNEIF